jgi:hypothetical protein
MAKIGDIIFGKSKDDAPEVPKFRKPDETEVERLGKEHKAGCQRASDGIKSVIEMMAGSGVPVIMAEAAIDAELEVEKIKQLGAEMIKQYREDTEAEHTILRKNAEVEEEKAANTKKIRKLIKEKIGVTGEEKEE